MRLSHGWIESYATTAATAPPYICIIRTPDRTTEADVGKTQERGLS